MKIEKMSEDKIKITLSVDDLKERNIDLYSFMYNSPESQDLFWEMIHQAELEYGFHVDESMIYIEASASSGGIFTLIVTKTTEKDSMTSLRQKLKKGTFKLKRKVLSKELKSHLYVFSSFEDICDFCRIIDITKIEKNTLYLYHQSYYLETASMPYTNILEYANIVNAPELIENRLAEYGKVIIEDHALQMIQKTFLKPKRKKKI